ncbi:DUF924 domain-containing protein [Massilia forsythiae]|uniref:DUF924 domain-containing protein n=1 Tax=Massilia forsythiae TaxID=2728020 RepID=A0A7Z2ZS95_9BURK|nr:DUF924 family protein [Massilia forsythiae]QJD99949.1 DUF924 domain-containing protein [Massilia forsythiae]
MQDQRTATQPQDGPAQAVPAWAQEVLEFWFGAPGSAEAGQARREWFIKSDAFDALIRTRFGELIATALDGGLDDWEQGSAQAQLARILVLDQFTRNVLRGTPQAFAGDARALAAARRMVDSGLDQALAPLQRAFVYLPFEHAEDSAMQERAVALFAALATSSPGFDEMLDYARRHRDVIARFGRFPHRNEILGRDSTADETDFLRQPGSRF